MIYYHLLFPDCVNGDQHFSVAIPEIKDGETIQEKVWLAKEELNKPSYTAEEVVAKLCEMQGWTYTSDEAINILLVKW